MDIFTHWFFTYLITFGAQTLRFNEYAMVFGIILGISPDFDILWYPLGRKFPIWRHRGASHSIFFILIETIILSLIFAPIINVNFFILFLIGLFSGLGHICLDVLTTIGIPVFWPFSKRGVHLDLERAINPYFTGISIFMIIFLFQLRAIKFDYSLYLILINVIITCIIVYYIFKLLIKLYIQSKNSTLNFKIRAIPTAGLFKWYLVGKNVDAGKFRLKYCRYDFIRDKVPNFKYFSCDHSESTKPPLDTTEKAKAYTYNIAEVRSFIEKFKYPLAEVKQNQTGEQWTVFWFPLELMGLNRAMAIQVDINADGVYKTKSAFFRKYTNI